MIFESEDNFLAFPLGLSFSYENLSFMKDPSQSGLTVQQQLAYQADFSTYMNIIPDDNILWTPDPNRLLWNEVKSMLNNAIFAESTLSQEDNNLLDEAIDFLTDIQKQTDNTETCTNSPEVVKYYQYMENYNMAMTTYLDEKITVENSNGIEGKALKEQWDTFRQRELISLVDKAEQEWINLGFKVQVERYQGLRKTLEPKKYLNLYRDAYLNEISLAGLSSLNDIGTQFCVTFFSPFDIFDTSLPWMTISLTKEEIISLKESSSDELSKLFGELDISDEIESISLEYANVVISRPWLKPEFFTSRYWKLPDDIVISDGNLPRSGKVPAYIDSMIVVRKIKITKKKSNASKPTTLKLIGKNSIQEFKAKRLVIRIPTPRPSKTVDKSVTITKTPILVGNWKANTTSVVVNRQEAVKITTNQIRKYTTANYNRSTIKTPRSNITSGLMLNPGQRVTTEVYDFGGVAVLAFVCTRVPKCPDPDDSLQWNN